MHDIVNEKAEYGNYKYYYTNPAQIMDSMRKVMEKYGLGEAGKKVPVKDEEKVVKVYEEDDPEAERILGTSLHNASLSNAIILKRNSTKSKSRERTNRKEKRLRKRTTS